MELPTESVTDKSALGVPFEFWRNIYTLALSELKKGLGGLAQKKRTTESTLMPNRTWKNFLLMQHLA